MIIKRVNIKLCRNNVKTMIFCRLTGALLQVLAKSYIKNHPEFFKDSPKSKKKISRGVKMLSGNIAIIYPIITVLAKHGLTAGTISGVGIVFKRITLTVIRRCLHESMPPHLEKKKFILPGCGKRKIFRMQLKYTILI